MSEAEAIVGIKKWGNNLGVRLPSSVAKAAQLHAEQKVRVRVDAQGVHITPLDDDALSLDERLARFDPTRHGGEALAVPGVGAEQW